MTNESRKQQPTGAVFHCLLAVAFVLCLPPFKAHAAGVIVSLTDSELRNAIAGGGTVTFATDGILTVTNTLQITNAVRIDGTGHNVTISGGGSVRVLLVSSSGSLVLSHITIADGYNYSTVGGGGLLNYGSVGISDCTFSNNVSAPSGNVELGTGGGAIYQWETAKSLRITRSLFLRNRSVAFSGGAITCGLGAVPGGAGNIYVTDCTFYANSSASPVYAGGAVSFEGPFTGPISFLNCTFAWNTNGSIAYWNFPLTTPGAIPTLANCILGSSVNTTNAFGIADAGHNLCSDSSSVFTNLTSVRNVDPLLGPLGQFGGPTLTIPLVVGSPAADSGDDTLAPATDQRGVPRPVGLHSDIGAFEGVVPQNNQVEIGFTQPQYRVSAVPGIATVVIRRSGPLDTPASVSFSAQGVTAVNGVDFVATNLAVSFSNFESEKMVAVQVLGGQPDVDRTVLLTLTNPVGAILSLPNSSQLTIQRTIIDTNQAQLLVDFTDTALRLAMSAGGAIRVTNDGIITLTNTLLVDKQVSLNADGHSLTIQGNNSFRLFNVEALGSLILQGVTVTGGAAVGLDGDQFQIDSTAAYGGAAFVDRGTLTLLNCHVWTNVARGGAGASGTGFSGNGADAAGGAVYIVGGVLYATNSDFVGNSAIAGPGGTNAGTMSDLSFTGKGGQAFGGAVFGSSSTINTANSLWRLNQAIGGMGGWLPFNLFSQRSGDALGGAIFQTTGTATVISCDFMLNKGFSATANGFSLGDGGNVLGGAVCNSNGLLMVYGGKLETNSAIGGDSWKNSIPGGGMGGAIANLDQMLISGCGIQGNHATGGIQGGPGMGGGLYNSGRLQVDDSLLEANAATGGTYGGTAFGGAIYSSGTLLVTNVTMAFNSAEGGYTGSWAAQPNGLAGALYNSNGTVFCINNTIWNNNASWHWYPGGGNRSLTNGLGGGIFTTNGLTSLQNSLLVSNFNGANGFGPITDAGHNISSDASCALATTGSLINTDPLIGPLGDYGGPTATIPLLAGSPAIDSGGAAGSPDHDQRGHPRPFGNGVDVGAFESSPPYVISGNVYGSTLADEVTVSAGNIAVVTTNRGMFVLSGLTSGNRTVVVTNQNYIFVPASQDVAVGPDRIGLRIHAYRWRALSPEPVTNGIAQVVLAETEGSTWRLLSSTNTLDWEPVATNTVGASSLVDFTLPGNSSPTVLYRAVTP